ncbi:MAG: Mur ligase family protein [Candidatus Colwellbacteria bacterium]|nr:Mur ligase family protein [Candidatus Colwellbacteria bacterium]
MKGDIMAAIKAAPRVHVLGFAGQEGRAVLDYLIDKVEHLSAHENTSRDGFMSRFLSFSDAYTREEAEAMADRFITSGIDLHFDDEYLSGVNDGDVVIAPQAYRRHPANASVIEKEEMGDISIFQAIEVAFDIMKCRSIGVTGTAGKSTTVTHIKNILAASGGRFYFSGNDRDNAWDLFALESMEENEFALFEISHRHLMNLSSGPDIAVITNIYPHHLDDAGSFDNYIEIKKNLIRYQPASGSAIVNWGLLSTGLISDDDTPARLYSFGGPVGASDAYIDQDMIKAEAGGGEVDITEVIDLPFSGEHNMMNALGAVMAGLIAGFSPDIIRAGLMAWKPLRYRMEEIYSSDGFSIINDGKSSDPLATIEAVRSVPDIDVLVMGGVREGAKEGEFTALAAEIADRGVRNVIVYGKSRDIVLADLMKVLQDTGVNVVQSEHHDEAFIGAFEMASGGAIVFSPACQSFDEFKDYRERSEAWNAAAKKFIETNGQID